jgi:hypothetical protein
MDTVTGPLSRRVTHEDRQGSQPLFVAAADAWQKEDMQAFMRLYPGGLWRFESGVEAGHGK